MEQCLSLLTAISLRMPLGIVFFVLTAAAVGAAAAATLGGGGGHSHLPCG